jgi:hypothetical protein
MNNEEVENGAKVRLCVVAVLCKRYIDFKYFERDNKKNNEDFIWVYDYPSMMGRTYDRIEKVFDWYEMDNAGEILKCIEQRLRYKFKPLYSPTRTESEFSDLIINGNGRRKKPIL